MKCPKCGYIGFEQAERCRNCGYDFSLAPQAAPGDLTLRNEPAGPLADLDLAEAGSPATLTPPGRSRRRHDPAFGPGITPPPGALPLFGGEALEDLPIVPTSEPTPPLAVRRAPSPLSKPRPRPTPRPADPQPVLAFSGEPGAEPPDADASAPAETAPAVAPRGRRLAAGAIDAALLVAIDLVVLYFTLRICRLPASDARALPLAPLAAFLALLNGGYLALFTGAGGQTIGQMAAGVRVVGDDHQRLTPGQAVARTLLLAGSLLPAGLGLLSILWDRGGLGLHDRLSGTRVVRVAGS